MPSRARRVLRYFELAAKAHPEPQDRMTIHFVEQLLALGYDVALPSAHKPAAVAATKDGRVWAAKADTRYEAIVTLFETISENMS